MTIIKKISTLLLTLIFCSSISLAAESTAGNFASDSAVTTAVKAKMLADKTVSSLDISVETNNGVVKLSGTVPTDKEASAAISTAASTRGVKNVDASELAVQRSTQPFSDTVITAKVKGTFLKEKILGERSIGVTNINVETKEGVVYLTGRATPTQAKNAIKLAKSIDGVKNVRSRIKINQSEEG